MIRASVCIAIAVWIAPASANAQHTPAPQKSGARTAGERVAYAKARCVYDALTKAGSHFPPVIDPAPKITPEIQKRAEIDLAEYRRLSLAGVKACLSMADVYELGRYSFFEDLALAAGSGCMVHKAPASRFDRTPNNNTGDLVNGATKWEAVSETGDYNAHPFFKGQSDARAGHQFVRDKSMVCRTILDEYGPNGRRFAGLVRPGR